MNIFRHEDYLCIINKESMNGCVAGCQYIPSVEYFAHWMYHGHLLLEHEEHYQKRTWRNKTAISGPDEPLLLTVPLRKGKNQQVRITDVLIAYDTPWPKIHFNSIQSAYGKTAFYEEIVPVLEMMYHTPYETLWNFNLAFLKHITSFLRGSWPFDLTTGFQHEYPHDMIDIRGGVACGLSPDDLNRFPEYPQVQRIHKMHQPNLCILDALCHLGPETSDYLVRYGAKRYEK